MFAGLQSFTESDVVFEIDEDHLEGRRVIRPLPRRARRTTAPLPAGTQLVAVNSADRGASVRACVFTSLT